MKKVLAISMLFFFASGVVIAQEEKLKKCSTYDQLEELFKMYPELEDHYYTQRLLTNSKMEAIFAGNQTGQKAAIYRIPVVFHILHEYGSENISDAQVYDAMRVINEEFNNNDPDIVNLLAPFDTLVGDGQIEFVLASVDPYGNCTNGIEHIYSHETNYGDIFSKLNQWNRARYLNIWVVNQIGGTAGSGAAGYSFPPAATDGTGFFIDGIVVNNSYVGSTGTSTPSAESTLTHEIGHYLNLDHTWGGTNEPEEACGEDGVPDTPITAGHASCPISSYPASWINCDTAGVIIEDVQNYMEYSYCSYHFTPDQVTFMHNALGEVAGQRNNLWIDTTLMLTGTLNQTLPQTAASVPLCAPIADFKASSKSVCLNAPMTFTDASYNAVIDTWEWTFEDGSPANSTDQNPTVSFTSPGLKTVTLTVSNAAGSGTETRTQYIYVSNIWADFNGPTSIDLNGPSAYWFAENNIENNDAKFMLANGVGYDNSRAYKLNNYKDVSNADPFSDEFFYYGRLGGSVDELISPSFDLRYTTGTEVSFKFAYATNATQVSDITESLKAYFSDNCGETWTAASISVNGSGPAASLTGSNLVTGGYAGNSDYTPTTNVEWREGTFNVASNSEHMRFKLVFEASDLSSNFYVDNINVTGTLGLVSDEMLLMDLNIYPNPSSNGQGINVSYTAQDEAVTFILRDAQGKLISTQVIESTNSMIETTLNGTQQLGAGCYFLEVSTGEHSTTRKVVVM